RLHHRAGGRARQYRPRAGPDRRAPEPRPAHRLRGRDTQRSGAHRAIPPRAQRFPVPGAVVRHPQLPGEPPVATGVECMSATHPITAVTGSSGAGTTSVMRTFEQIFRREQVTAAFVEGDSFHRYDRVAMRKKMSDALAQGDYSYSHFGPDANLFDELDSL